MTYELWSRMQLPTNDEEETVGWLLDFISNQSDSLIFVVTAVTGKISSSPSGNDD